MFKKTIATLEQLQRRSLHVSVTLPEDAHGFIDRRCSSRQCKSDFKVHGDDWSEKVQDAQVFCPICRFAAASDQWKTPQQTAHLRSIGRAKVVRTIRNALSEDARAFNSTHSRRGIFKMSLTLKPSAGPFVVPISASEALEARTACEKCGCRYASIGAAFFCPACGHNSARTTFAQVVTTVRDLMNQLPAVVASVAAVSSKDASRDFERGTVEHSLQRLVSAFQRFAEAAFAEVPAAAALNPRRNVFQNLGEASDLWEQAIGRRYEHMLAPGELADLQRLFQQRHLLAHREGMVDQDYIDRSGDHAYAVGQRLVVRVEHVVLLAALVERLSTELAGHAWPP